MILDDFDIKSNKSCIDINFILSVIANLRPLRLGLIRALSEWDDLKKETRKNANDNNHAQDKFRDFSNLGSLLVKVEERMNDKLDNFKENALFPLKQNIDWAHRALKS